MAIIEERRIHSLENKDIKQRYAPQRPAPPNMPSLHFIANFCGARRSGKTTSAVNMAKAYFANNSFDKLYLISGSAHTEPKYKELPEPAMTMEVYSNLAFDGMIDHIKSDLHEYERYKDDLKVWETFKREYVDGNKNAELMDLSMYLRLDAMNWDKPATRFEHGPPSSLILIDDMQGSALYQSSSKNAVAAFAFKHRHFLTSMIFLTQAYTSGGVPRAVRANISFLALFRTKDHRAARQIAEESAGSVAPDEFLALWDHAVKDNPHDFFAVDFDQRDPKKMFRRNFNTFLSIK